MPLQGLVNTLSVTAPELRSETIIASVLAVAQDDLLVGKLVVARLFVVHEGGAFRWRETNLGLIFSQVSVSSHEAHTVSINPRSYWLPFTSAWLDGYGL